MLSNFNVRVLKPKRWNQRARLSLKNRSKKDIRYFFLLIHWIILLSINRTLVICVGSYFFYWVKKTYNFFIPLIPVCTWQLRTCFYVGCCMFAALRMCYLYLCRRGCTVSSRRWENPIYLIQFIKTLNIIVYYILYNIVLHSAHRFWINCYCYAYCYWLNFLCHGNDTEQKFRHCYWWPIYIIYC